MYQIKKQFHFSASHILEGLPAGHMCGRLHGHNYIVEIVLECQDSGINDVGFVQDYNDLGEIKDWLDENWDHKHLNDVFPQDLNPSAENMARFLFDHFRVDFPKLAEVRVSETPKTWASYRPRGFQRKVYWIGDP